MSKYAMHEHDKAVWGGKTSEERFFEKVRKPNGEEGCWEWIPKHRSSDGRPRYRQMEAYRWAYLHFVGSYPNGYVLDHYVCDNKECVNYNHLKPITVAEHGRKSQAQRIKHGNRYVRGLPKWPLT